ncbi:hypothetical protein F4777DRAFT_574132 [Nemania sp. FL0916]|nr:hypothetical protein F4777DRAFT_574132 [Nemania sp. FL0916]
MDLCLSRDLKAERGFLTIGPVINAAHARYLPINLLIPIIPIIIVTLNIAIVSIVAVNPSLPSSPSSSSPSSPGYRVCRFWKCMGEMDQQSFPMKADSQRVEWIPPHLRRTPAVVPVSEQDTKSQVSKTHDRDTENSQKSPSKSLTSSKMPSSITYSSPTNYRWTDTQQNRPQTPNQKVEPLKSHFTSSSNHSGQSHAPRQANQPCESTHMIVLARKLNSVRPGLAKSYQADPNHNGTPPGKDKLNGIHPELVKSRCPDPSYNGGPLNKDNLNGITPELAKSRQADLNHNDTPPSEAKPYVRHPALEESRWADPNYNGGPLSIEKQRKYYPQLAKSRWSDPNYNGGPLNTDKGKEIVPEIKENTQEVETISLDPRRNWPTEPLQIDQGATDFDPSHSLPDRNNTSDDVSCSVEEEYVPDHVTNYIKDWIRDAHVVKADFLSQDIEYHQDCDVETYKGVLMDPIEYPQTRCQELMSYEQLTQTSASRVREFGELARRDKKIRLMQKVANQATAAIPTTQEAAQTFLDEHPNPNNIQIPCHIRPAVESDIEAITAIYNQEVDSGYGVIDIYPIKCNDMLNLYRRCQAGHMPCVVAVDGLHGATDGSCQGVIGFSMVSPVSRGIGGSFDTLSRCGGKLLAVVKPEYRRKKIGSALIDLLMTNCTGWYISKQGYQFVNSTHDWISTEYGSNQRKFWYLESEVMIRSRANKDATRKGEEFQWISNFLEVKFDLLLKNHDETCLYDPQQQIWLDRLIFRRPCHMIRS